MAEYVLLSGTHSSRNKKGERKFFYPGDTVSLSDADYMSFADKFDPVSGKGKKAKSDSGSTRSEVINRVGEKAGSALIKAGFASLSAIDDADDDELLAVDGVGQATLNKLRGV